MEKIRLFIAGQDPFSVRGLASIFSSETVYEVVGSITTAEAVDNAVALQPDVVLIDTADDVASCIPRISTLRKECPYSLVLVLVGDGIGDDLPGLLAVGIDGCLPRGIMRGCLVKAVELICRAGLYCLPNSAKKTYSHLRLEKDALNTSNKNNTIERYDFLTKRELEILKLMAKNLSNREIAQKLYISEPTVKTHVSSILRKLGQQNRSQAIVYSYKNGLVDKALGLEK